MDQISNVQTAADYTDALTLGPTNYDAISVNIWNNSCIAQTFELGPGGDYQLGAWGSESLEAANSTFTLANCGGVRFRDNPDTPGVHARIVAYAWKSGDVQKIGGIQLAGTISGTGAVTPGGALLTGIIPATGNTPTAGSGFTYTHVNGSGVYVFTFTTAYAAAPVVQATILSDNSTGVDTVQVSPVTTMGFTATVQRVGAGTTDIAFMFLVSAVT